MMFQTHCYDSWLSPAARKSAFFSWSQLGGTLPAPLFIFLSGISFALVTERLREKGASANEIAKTTIWRGAEIFGLGLLFRVQEFSLGLPWAPWTDLLRVDVLNILGLGMMLMGVVCRLSAVGAREQTGATQTLGSASQLTAALRKRGMWAGLCAAAVVALATPPVWTTHRPNFLPWPLESYINGVHIFDKPQPWLFPLFPWSAFAFAGLAVGFFLFTDIAKRKEGLVFGALGVAGILACFVSQKLDALHFQVYSVYDYWHTSPNFLLMRCGILLIILSLIYAWCRWGLAQLAFSPILQLGKTSLLVYWVHIEFVYGRFSILPKRQCSIFVASTGLAIIFLSMVVLSVVRTKWKKRRANAQKLATVPSAA
ncbi:MAG TPA: heparan-alpha-glucosaminide N-acetyltransferase domain-containing protein [Candidatus Methylomirabilis sp.]|nr:heparan-alpha-glucosaminide N-acetyltransferase domain-containing protein [Candidatus Methylomirabilis sp.]